MLQWFDNFSSYGTTNALMLNGLYAENAGALVADPDVTETGIVWRASGSGPGSGTTLRKVLPAARATIGVSLRLWLASLPSTGDMSALPIVMADASNNPLVSLCVTTTGAVQLRRASDGVDSGTLIAETEGPVLVANAWQQLELKVFHSATVGTVELRVGGGTVISGTGLNTGAAACAQVRQIKDNRITSAGITWYIKDYVIWDTTGSYNNDFLGSVSVVDLVPDSDVAVAGWTISTGGSGFDILNNSPPVDTDYISAPDPPPAASQFTLTDLPVDVSSVRGVMTVTRAFKSDGGDGNLQAGVYSNGSVALGADRPMTVAPTYWVDIHEEDPDTSAPWTPEAIDNAELTLERTL